MDEKTAMLYSQLHSYKALVRKTSGFIKWALDRVQNPYIACSFGKDSAVMLNLVLQQRRNIPVRFIRWFAETEFIDNYDEVINQWGPLNLQQVELNRNTINDRVKDRYDVSDTDYDSYFIGLRKDESVARRITLKKSGMFYKNKQGLVRISPLSDWTEKDITAYVVSNSLPTLNTYKMQGYKSRTSSRIPRSDFGIRDSFLSELKQRDFNSYQLLLKKYPEIIKS